MGETLLSPDGVRLTLGVFDMDLGSSGSTGVLAKEVVTLYGYDSYEFVQPSTYPAEMVNADNTQVSFSEITDAYGQDEAMPSPSPTPKAAKSATFPSQPGKSDLQRGTSAENMVESTAHFGRRIPLNHSAPHCAACSIYPG